jgi:nitroreductase
MTRVSEVIRRRKSIVLFDNKEVEQEKLDLIFESARWAPSSFNEQPWRFIYAHKSNPRDHGKIADALNDHNRFWAAKAPVLIVVIAKTKLSHAFYDVGQAVATLTLQATDLGLYMRQMAGFHSDIAIANLGIPQGFEPIAIIALGYEGEVDENTDERLAWKQNHERTRKPVDEVVREGSWS